MRASITSALLLAFPLALVGCAPEPMVAPLDGSPSLLAQRGDPDDHASTKRIHGTLEATESGTPSPGTPVVVRRLEGWGTASHLGRFTVVGDITLNLATATGSGSGTYTAANGDVLSVTSVGQAVVAAGFATVTETVTITGGTGRFAGATGTLTVVRRVTQATGRSTGTIDGTVTLAR
jgi:hypothetical protein